MTPRAGRRTRRLPITTVSARLGLALWCAFLIVGCSITPSPSPTDESAFPPVLTVDNRGGPAFTVLIGGVEVARVSCDAGASISPGQAGVPDLPWDLSVVRVRDGTVVLEAHVVALPRWFTQIGDDTGGGGLSTVAVAGPPGPSCPLTG